MRVAIVGSRKFSELDRVRAYVRSLPPDTVIVSGGAWGVDQAAVSEARRCGMGTEVFTPNYSRDGDRAPLYRNRQIATECDRMVAFWDGKSTGTMHAVRCARALEKPVQIVISGEYER